MGVKEHKYHAVKNIQCAVLTVSDSRTEENDDSGRTIIDALKKNDHGVGHYEIIKDDKAQINDEISSLLADSKIQAIIVNGGTGIGNRDVTYEAVTPLLEKELKGFGELFRALSYKEIGSAAMMSRAFAGVAKGKLVLCMPGSPNACVLGMRELIIPELGHMVWEVTK
jgi:molybdenum cofactor biosynthesis protein B